MQGLAKIGLVSSTAAPLRGAPDPLALRANPATMPGVKLVKLIKLVKFFKLVKLVKLVKLQLN